MPFKQDLISAKKFDFLKNKGTDDAIALLSKFIYENLSNSKPMVVAFLDYSKAFDTVNHEFYHPSCTIWESEVFAYHFLKVTCKTDHKLLRLRYQKSSNKDKCWSTSGLNYRHTIVHSIYK